VEQAKAPIQTAELAAALAEVRLGSSSQKLAVQKTTSAPSSRRSSIDIGSQSLSNFVLPAAVSAEAMPLLHAGTLAMLVGGGSKPASIKEEKEVAEGSDLKEHVGRTGSASVSSTASTSSTSELPKSLDRVPSLSALAPHLTLLIPISSFNTLKDPQRLKLAIANAKGNFGGGGSQSSLNPRPAYVDLTASPLERWQG